MKSPTLCMICEAVGPYNAIGKIAASEVRAALKSGYDVSVVAHRLDPALQAEVEWLKLYNPPRGFAIKWLSARHFIRRALAGRTFDVVHGHQPQIADMCDVFQCHFLTRAAAERGCLVSGSGLAATMRQWQQQAIMHAEDRCYRRWNPATRMLFVSELIQRECQRLHGLPREWRVLENAAPPWDPVSAQERSDARADYGLTDTPQPVIGYLGGLQRRKGYVELLDAMAEAADVFLLMAGQHTERYADDRLAGRMRGLGLIEPRRFLAACDAIIVPSRFDPCPMVVLEAASRGVPVIASEGVGNRATLLEYEAGQPWEPGQPLAPVVRRLLNRMDTFREGCRQLVRNHGQDENMAVLLNIYDDVLQSKAGVDGVHRQSQDAVPATVSCVSEL